MGKLWLNMDNLCGNQIEFPTYALLNTDLFCKDIAIRSVLQVFLVIIPQIIWLFQTFLLPWHHQNLPSLFIMLRSAGRFFYYTYMQTSFAKPYSSPEQIVQVLKSRGMLIKDEHRVENYLMNIGYHLRINLIKHWQSQTRNWLQARKITLKIFDKILLRTTLLHG